MKINLRMTIVNLLCLFNYLMFRLVKWNGTQVHTQDPLLYRNVKYILLHNILFHL